MRRWIAAYDTAFPDRSDRLTIQDVSPFHAAANYFRDLFRHYDIVQCYATDPIYGMLAEKRPLVAFEHGTLRVFTTGDCRCNALPL